MTFNEYIKNSNLTKSNSNLNETQYSIQKYGISGNFDDCWIGFANEMGRGGYSTDEVKIFKAPVNKVYNSTKNVIDAVNLLIKAEKEYKYAKNELAAFLNTSDGSNLDGSIRKVLKILEPLVKDAIDNCESLSLNQ